LEVTFGTTVTVDSKVKLLKKIVAYTLFPGGVALAGPNKDDIARPFEYQVLNVPLMKQNQWIFSL